MIRATLDKCRRWRTIERSAVLLMRKGLTGGITPEMARLRRRALVIEAMEIRRLRR